MKVIQLKYVYVLIGLAVVLSDRAQAGSEEKCSALGGNCVCSEPLNSNTHDGGSTAWEWGSGGKFYDMDDSDAKECSRPGSEMYCSADPGMTPVPASTQPLPAGNRLQFVLRHKGINICHIGTGSFFLDRNTGTTYCNRHYRRWDPASEWPGPGIINEPQQKITTIGGCAKVNPGDPCVLENGIKIQISMRDGINAEAVADILGGADSPWAGFTDGAGYFGNARDNCTSQFCRFETCLNFGTNGILTARRRMVEVGTGKVYEKINVGTISRPSATVDLNYGGGVAFFTQFTPGIIDYATHLIAVRLPYDDPNYWPGPACEVEGGCTGTPPSRLLVPGIPKILQSFLEFLMPNGWASESIDLKNKQNSKGN